MILVDTNVVSEPLRRAPEARVAEWLDAQALETLYLSAITVAELRFGVRSRCRPAAAGTGCTRIWRGRCCPCSLDGYWHSICRLRRPMRI